MKIEKPARDWFIAFTAGEYTNPEHTPILVYNQKMIILNQANFVSTSQSILFNVSMDFEQK